jgi:hypothetical protein
MIAKRRGEWESTGLMAVKLRERLEGIAPGPDCGRTIPSREGCVAGLVFSRRRPIAWLILTLGWAGCAELSLPETFSFSPQGVEFVLSGTATVLDSGGPCLSWLGDNGVTYHLFQSTRLANEDFDRITIPGTRSRLVMATRSDLEVTCGDGEIVEVRAVLEIVE